MGNWGFTFKSDQTIGEKRIWSEQIFKCQLAMLIVFLYFVLQTHFYQYHQTKKNNHFLCKGQEQVFFLLSVAITMIKQEVPDSGRYRLIPFHSRNLWSRLYPSETQFTGCNLPQPHMYFMSFLHVLCIVCNVCTDVDCYSNPNCPSGIIKIIHPSMTYGLHHYFGVFLWDLLTMAEV